MPQTFKGLNTFAGVVWATNVYNLLVGTHAGDGSALINLNGTSLVGTLPDARLSTNVALRNANQTFAGSNIFAGVARLTNATNFLVGAFAGDGSALSNLLAAKLLGTAPSATNFTGALAGDVRGAQGATVVSTVSGLSASNVAAGANAANAATINNTPGTLVKRDSSGSFRAGTITGAFTGDGGGLTGLDAVQLTAGTVADGRLSANVALLSANQIFTGSNSFAGVARLTNATNFLVGAFAGDGSALSNLPAAKLLGMAPSATNFTGALAGDVRGAQGATVVSTVSGLSASSVAAGANAANAATIKNTPGTLVKRDSSGSFRAGTITGAFTGDGGGLTGLDAARLTAGTVADGRLSANVALLSANQIFTGSNSFAGVARLTNATNFLVGAFAGDGSALSNLPAAKLLGTAPSATNFTGALAGDVRGAQGATVVSTVSGLSASSVAAGANAANAATIDNTPGTLVKRDSSGSFRRRYHHRGVYRRWRRVDRPGRS